MEELKPKYLRLKSTRNKPLNDKEIAAVIRKANKIFIKEAGRMEIAIKVYNFFYVTVMRKTKFRNKGYRVGRARKRNKISQIIGGLLNHCNNRT